VSDTTLSDPQVRATQNDWYLYFSRDPAYGSDGRVRAVIEVVTDELIAGDGGPTRAWRNTYLDTVDLRDFPRPRPASELVAHDGLEHTIEEMSNEEFQELISDGTIVPISVPSGRTQSAT
jgi:hypothetical protein